MALQDVGVVSTTFLSASTYRSILPLLFLFVFWRVSSCFLLFVLLESLFCDDTKESENAFISLLQDIVQPRLNLVDNEQAVLFPLLLHHITSNFGKTRR